MASGIQASICRIRVGSEGWVERNSGGRPDLCEAAAMAATVLAATIAPESAGRHRRSRMGESYQIGPFLRVTTVAMVASVSMRPASISILIEAIRAGSAVGAPELSR
jgi:hypothetical protein